MATTLATLVAALQDDTGVGSGVLATATCERFLNDTIRRMTRRHTFRGNLRSLPLVVKAGADATPLPDDFISEKALWMTVSSATSPSSALRFVERLQRPFWIIGLDPLTVRDTVFPAVAAPSTTQPSPGYYLWGLDLYVVPSPNVDTTFVLDYGRLMPDLTGAQRNWFTDLLPDVVSAGANAVAFAYLHQTEETATWAQIFETRLTDAIRYDDTTNASGLTQNRGRTS